MTQEAQQVVTPLAALKLALEALEKNTKHLPVHFDNHFEAITAIKEALLAQKQEPVCPDCKAKVLYECVACSSNNYPPKTEQEPVGALTLGGIIDTSDGPEYEEWDIEWNSRAIEALQERLVTGDPVTLEIYTSPQPAHRTWVGLTDEEYAKLAEEFGPFPINQIEAKLKEKNNVN